MSKNFKDKFSNIFWIGGSPCCGKSSITEMLAKKYDFDVCKCDDFMFDHMKKSNEKDHPIMNKQLNMTFNEMWMRPVETQVKEEVEFYREEFKMIMEEIEKYKGSKTLIVEGAALLPELIKSIGIDRSRLIYLVPEAKFQLEHYSKRPWINEILDQCEEPQKAFQNWMNRDIEFAKIVHQKANEYGMKVILVDGRASLEDNFNIVEKHFALK